jgi:hypothetical protein
MNKKARKKRPYFNRCAAQKNRNSNGIRYNSPAKNSAGDGLERFVHHGLQMIERLLYGQRVHLAAVVFA